MQDELTLDQVLQPRTVPGQWDSMSRSSAPGAIDEGTPMPRPLLLAGTSSLGCRTGGTRIGKLLKRYKRSSRKLDTLQVAVRRRDHPDILGPVRMPSVWWKSVGTLFINLGFIRFFSRDVDNRLDNTGQDFVGGFRSQCIKLKTAGS
jgi:hypothetical protein